MSSKNHPSGRTAQQQQGGGGGNQPTHVLFQGDKAVLATKQRIANRQWEGIGVLAGVGVIESKLAIARKQDGEQERHGPPTVPPTCVVNDPANMHHNDVNNNPRTPEEDQPTTTATTTIASTDSDNINSLSNTNNSAVGQIEQNRDFYTHQQQVTATEQQEQHADNTGSANNTGTIETQDQQRGEQQQEVAYDAYVVDEEEQAEYRRQREQELLQEMERQAFNELVRTLPHAEEVDQEELRQQQEQTSRAATQRRRKLLMRKAAAVTALAIAIMVACILAANLLKDDTNEKTSREDQIAWILRKVSGDAIYNKSSPRHDAFRWLVDEDPMQLRVGGEGVKSYTIVERYVVVLFFLVTGGLSNWTDSFGFLGNTSVCDWLDPTVYKGIVCHDSGSVRVLQVYENNIYGTLPDELSALEELEILVLPGNKLFGTIPSTLNKNTRLKRISLQWNLVSGKIPDLSSLRSMQTIELNGNSLTGTLPGWVTSFGELGAISVFDNLLSGTIPPFASQDGLESVFLSDNLFEGSIPQSLGSLSVLEKLYVSYNILSGSIPSWLGQVTKLQELFAESNSLTGTIPTEIGNLRDLGGLGLDDNGFTGTIPTELGGLTDLVVVSLSGNHLTGTIPSELAGLEELNYLYLHNNTLTGDVSELCFNQEDGQKNSGLEQVVRFSTDCDDKILDPEVVCPCCTHCCNDMTGDCNPVKTQEERCQEKALQWEGSAGDDSGSACECSEGGHVVSCMDSNCMYCNDADGTLCYIDAGTGMELSIEYGSFAVSIQYVRGRDELVSLRVGDGRCLAAINGRGCASCNTNVVCADGYLTYHVDCSNLGYGGALTACNEGDDPFVMLWDIANQFAYITDFPIRHDCVPYNTSEASGHA